MPETPAKLDLFSQPHLQMKKLVEQINYKLHRTNFNDDLAFSKLITSLKISFEQLANHEKIEKEHIMNNLKKRMPQNTSVLSDCKHHASGHCHLEQVQNLLTKGLNFAGSGKISGRNKFKRELVREVRTFNKEYFPHMEEEESLFQPLLMQYFSEEELIDLHIKIIELHHIQLTQPKIREEVGSVNSSNILEAPNEIIVKILGFLDVNDLLSISQTCTRFQLLSFTPILWKHLHISNWINKIYSNFAPNPITPLTNLPLSKPQDFGDREFLILTFVIKKVLPLCGNSTESLIIVNSESIRSNMLLTILQSCHNLHYLDLSNSSIDDMAFGMPHLALKLPNLVHINLTNCQALTDKSLQRLSRAICYPSFTLNRDTPDNSFNYSPLKFLSLSGCHQMTCTGIKSLLSTKIFDELVHLDFSGCPFISGEILSTLVDHSPNLDPENIFYCNNILDGPCPHLASGCLNRGDPTKFCCMQMLD